MAYYIDNPDWDASDWDSDVSVDDIPAVEPNPPKYLFTSAGDFARRHGNGTKAEFKLEKAAIKSFNNKLRVFYTWPIVVLGKDGAHGNWLFLVKVGADDSSLPKEGETCIMKFPQGDVTYEQSKDGGKRFHSKTKFTLRQAYRVDNPCSQWGIKDDHWEQAMAFELALQIPTKKSLLQPIIDAETAEKGFTSIPRPKGFELQVAFELRLSSSTSFEELGALDKFKEAMNTDSTRLSSGMKYRRPAFEYLMNFTPQVHVSLFDSFPHLADPFRRPQTVSKELADMFAGMDAHQRAAYGGLDRIPNRICFVPGGPGAGKTHWNICLIAALQSQPKLDTAEEPDVPVSRNQVLYLVDINRSATDVANKLVETYKRLGLKRYVIRMYCWSDELGSATVNLLEAQKQELYHRISRQGQKKEDQKPDDPGPLAKYDKDKDKSDKIRIRRVALSSLTAGTFRSKSRYRDEKDSRRAPTLEEAVTSYFQEFKDTKYAELHQMCHVYSNDLDALRCDLVDKVYTDFLKLVDVIVTTPVTASKFSSSLRSSFDPKLVLMDEAPHARELSIMISIANFSPKAWIFTGDHRQTKPYVGSHGLRRNVNKHVLQLRTSTMERAFKANPNMPSLLINHRAKGGLEELASYMFYDGKMIPAVKPGTPGAIPASTEHLRNTYIMPLKPKSNQKDQVSRMLVVLKGYEFDREESRIQGSLYNQSHQDWVMNRLVARLIKDDQFLQTNGKDRGTILIMSPYKRAAIEYGKMITVLKGQEPLGLNGCIVEARTVDAAQGHEADVVILDFVSDWVTKHLEDPNRLCVALTRARQIELIIMHPDMENKLDNFRQFEDSPLAWMLNKCMVDGQFTRRVKRS